MPKFSAAKVLVALCFTGFFTQSLFAQATIRLPGIGINYEDSVRIVLIWNNPGGNCGWMDPVGAQTRDFILKSISGGDIGNPLTNPHIKIIPTHKADGTWTSWQDIKTLWGGDTLPHVIVHSNAGWGDASFNGPDNGPLWALFDSAAAHYIGVAEIGDDAAWLAKNTFGFTLTDNMPPPISDGTQYTGAKDSLLVGLHPKNDKLLDSTVYPYLNGIVLNTSYRILNGDSTLYFKPYMAGNTGGKDTIRCQADADKYTILPGQASKLTMLGFENASRNGARVIPADPTQELDVVVAFQDTIHPTPGSTTIRRAVALSIEPQFLKNTVALYQLTYDAIMYASLAWQLRPVSKITLQVSNSTIKAGDTTTITARLFRDTLEAPELEDSVTWQLDPLTKKPGDTLIVLVGKITRFTGTLAGHTVNIIASFKNSSGTTVTATAAIKVIPADPYRVVIEADSINSNPNASDPLGTTTLDSATNDKTVFAMTYDRFGNFTGLSSNATVWTPSKPASAIVNTPGPKYAGTIHRVTRTYDTLTVTATDGGLLPGTVKVVLQTGTITAIRLVDAAGLPVTAITMTTDDSKFVKIQVKWSNDPTTWVDGAGSWTLNPTNAITWSDINQLPVGNGSGSWTLDPKTPGSTNLTVSAGTIVSIPVPVTITPAPPSRATIELAHPTDSIIAGRPFQVLVKIYNTDGLVPGAWCSTSATYTDVLGNGTKTAIPTIVFNGNPIPVPLGTPTGECFSNGLDTIMVVLYNAPVSLDSTHTISLVLNNNTIDLPLVSTVPFHLFPGPLDLLALEYSNGTPMPGPVTLHYPDEAVNIYARGYDHWGNLIGPIRSNWTKTGSLHDLTPPTTNQVNVYIDASNAILDENGFVFATAPSGVIAGAFVSDSVQVILVPRKANLASALTKDTDGNGLLDQIWVKLDKSVSASLNSNIPVTNVSVVDTTNPATHAITKFIVQSIQPVNVVNDTTSTFIVYLKDSVDASNGILEPSNAIPETSWRPYISISGINGANTIINKQCKDGAGPVVWKVVCTKNNAMDRTKDLVTVTFSEPIQASGGNDLSINIQPSLVFSTWKKDGNSLVPDTSLLACNTVFPNPCIGVFYKIVDASTVQFNMLNQKTLFDYDFFSIRMLPSSQVSDKANPANLPVENNQKVRVELTGVVSPITIAPNPAIPTYFNVPDAHGDPSILVFKNDPNATHYAKDKGGTVLRFYISPGQGRITAYLNIYDVVGNMVNSVRKDGPTDDLMTEIRQTFVTGTQLDTASNYTYDVYWNGVNAKGMKTAPGVYHAFLYQTTYLDGSTKKSRQTGIIGIGR
jgi:hypothetical protein